MPTCERFPPCSAIAISKPASFTRPFKAVASKNKAPRVHRLLAASQAPCRPTCSSAPVSTVSSEARRNGSKLERKEPLKTMGSWPSCYASKTQLDEAWRCSFVRSKLMMNCQSCGMMARFCRRVCTPTVAMSMPSIMILPPHGSLIESVVYITACASLDEACARSARKSHE